MNPSACTKYDDKEESLESLSDIKIKRYESRHAMDFVVWGSLDTRQHDPSN